MAIGGNNQTLSVTIGANMDPSGVLSAVKQMQSAFSGLKLPGDIGADLEKSFGKATDLLKKYQTQLSKGINTKTDAKNITKTGSQINEVLDEIVTHINSINGQQIFLKADVSGLNTLKTNIEDARTAWKNAIQEFRKGSDIEKVLNEIAEKTTRSNLTQGSISSAKTLFDKGDLEGYRNALDSIYNRLKNLKDTTIKNVVENLGLQDAGSKVANLDQIKKRLEDISKIDFSGDSNVDTKFKAITTAVTEYETEVKRASQAGQNAFNNINVDKTVKDTRDLVDATDQYKNSVMSAKDQVQQLQQSTQYFFSLRNMINLLKRGISDAVQTVKELDKAMTETAVVTDFSVGDMWAKLPEYTANANKLGATIQDMYESTTLYYQQGLNTQQSMAIATETMKMARIAGLEAKDATDMMTAALRGFNMELNETSAERINDVYSNLAAKTASDTEEIGKAMQRTASIAHSAGMSFEGTAAFLAQAVETTREPAENIGTAMKTIVARFQEMKKNPLEITEVDGEEVSYNKVDAALQSIGVSLKDANGQFRELDKVFLDISKRWDSLSQTQQRYIATIAAGSRQQSRFIAMMGDYDRTVELMSYANDSAGASQEQFNKTLDSLEAKINKFQNAWDQFLMGIMNDSWVKGLVDAGTTILKTVNGIIDALSFGGKAKGLKSLLSIGTAGVALKAGGNLINKLIGGLGGLVDPTSSFGKGFWGAGKTTQEGTPATGMAGKITTPIVAKLNELIAVTRKANNLKDTNTQVTSTLGQYKNVSAMLRNPNSLNVKDVGTLFNGLSDEHAYTAFRNAPGTITAMKQAVVGQLPAEMQSVGGQLMTNIIRGMKKKEIPVKKGAELIGKPQLWGKYLGTETAQEFSKQYITSQKKLWETQTADARKQAWIRAGGSAFATDKGIQDYLIKNKESDFTKTFISNYKQIREEMEYLSKAPIELDKFQQLANNVGTLGSRFSSAGMSLQMFGSQLGQLSPALEGVGTLIARIGGMLSTFGMGISGIGSIVTGVGGRISTAMKLAKATSVGVSATGAEIASNFMAGLTGGMSAGPIAAIIAAVLVGGIAIAKGVADKKAREAGEEVRENFEQGFTETNKKIDSITEYKDRFNELSQGVDQFGHNINLTDEEFDEYLTISRELQELSPSLISGYNAEGQAILRKGAALDEVIDKLKEERDLSLRDYITDDSIQKLIGEYNTSDAYKSHNTIKKGDSGMGDAFNSEKSAISKAIKEAELEWSDFSQILDELGIGGAESINDLTNQQLSMITAHYTDIINKIKEFNPQIEEEAEDGLKEAFAETNNALEDVLTEGAPIVDALRQWMGQEKLDAIGLGLSEEFVSGFNSGLDGLMLEGLTNNWKPEEYKAQLRDYANEWEHLAGPTSTYSTILTEADKIQQQYLDHIGEDGTIQNYENDVEGLANQLELLAEQYKGTGTAGEVFAEQCQQQANNLRNYATEGVLTLGEALNTLSDEFASARGAQERFQKATEGGDYYTAAEGYKSIIDTMLDEKNTVGNGSDGSLTFWAGADELLGQKYVDSHTANEVVKQVEKIKGCFEDGLPGIQQFGDLLVENADKLKGLGEINEDTGQFEFNFKNLDDLEKYAELLGMSEDALAALIDKSRQYVPWNLSDPGAVRKAIEDSQYSMAGVSTRGENLVYTSESQFRAEARQQGIRGDDYTKTRSDAEERGVRFLNVENLTAKKGDGLYADQVLENIGLKGQDKTVENAVAAFTKMGLDLEDTKQVLMSDGIKLADGEEATAENIEKAYNEQAYAVENPTVTGIATDTSTLVSNTSAMLAAMGILTEDAKKEIDQATNEDTTQGYIDNLQNASSLSERNTARTTMEDKVSEYNALANKLIEAGRSETDPYVQKLRNAAEILQTELDAEAKNWNDKAVVANQYLKDNKIIPQNATANEQQAIQMHAVDIQNAIGTGDASVVVETLKQIETEGNLSIETMIALGQSINNLGVVDSSSILHFISEYYDKLKTIRQESNQPFEIQTKFTGEKLEDHISAVKEFTAQEYTYLVRADVSGDEKVTTLIDSINQEFGNGDQKTKTILIDAVAKTANGDAEGAHNILAESFGEDKAETIEKKIDVLCDGSVANKDEVVNALENELKEIPLNITGKAKATVDVDSLKTTNNNTMHYSTEVDTGAIDDAATKANNTTATITIDGNADEAKKAADAAKETINRKRASLKIDAVKGTGWNGSGWSINVSAHKRGRNYSIPTSSSISFGAAAQGMNLSKKKSPKGSNVTALVGEEGFEVGYIPSESRSVIFGSNGPEITSFPSDTIIYPHEQSKNIVRRGKNKHKSLGSFAGGNTGTSGGIPTSNSGGGSNTSYTQKVVDAAKKTGDKVAKSAENAAKAITRVSVWWENIARKTEATQRRMDNNANAFEKYIKEMSATLHKTGESISLGGGGGDDYIKNIKEYIEYNQTQFNMASQELAALQNSGITNQKQKNLKKQYKNNNVAVAQISYSSGKKKKTKNEFVDLSQYITADNQINEAALNTIKNVEKRKAVAEAANKELNDRISKQNAADDAIRKAEEALEKMSQELYETFFKWENELTKIWNITQQIERTEGNINRLKTYSELLDTQIASGLSTALETYEQSFSVFKTTLQQQQTNLQQTIAGIAEDRAVINRLISLDDKVTTLQNVQNKLIDNVTSGVLNETEQAGFTKYAAELEKEISAQTEAWKYLEVFQSADGTLQVQFNTDAFEQARTAGNITNDKAQAIQDYVKSLTESSKQLNERYVTVISNIKNFYSQLQTLRDNWADYANELWDISEAEQKKQVDNLKKLSDALSKTLKNLLDEVKRKIDERRQIEDNQKTETDITRKQQRLAMLRADTSGGHQVEIAQLEQEIADSQQNYQRTLEDQLINRLQDQADKAEQQREQQITLQEATLEAINNAALVDLWMSNPQQFYDDIKNAYMTANDADSKPKAIQEQLNRRFESLYNGLLNNQNEQAELITVINTLSEERDSLSKYFEEQITALDLIQQSVSDINNLVAKTGGASNIVEGGTEAKVSAAQLASTPPPAAPAVDTSVIDAYNATFNNAVSNGKLGKNEFLNLMSLGGAIGKTHAAVGQELVDVKGISWEEIIKAAIKAWGKQPAAAEVQVWWGGNVTKARKKGWKNAFGKDYPKYKTGGLADYTGPAWLDGTPSKPELVLNAKDTANFIALKDILGKVMGSTQSINNSYGGDNIFEININVDKIEKDYDVDRVADRVKKKILESSSYRNVTQVRNFR